MNHDFIKTHLRKKQTVVQGVAYANFTAVTWCWSSRLWNKHLEPWVMSFIWSSAGKQLILPGGLEALHQGQSLKTLIIAIIAACMHRILMTLFQVFYVFGS